MFHNRYSTTLRATINRKKKKKGPFLKLILKCWQIALGHVVLRKYTTGWSYCYDPEADSFSKTGHPKAICSVKNTVLFIKEQCFLSVYGCM